ncbi:shikimate kinase [Pacificoceanicola onchidii]|uniref:shikimate kinase n=1 Tax=Pacificoceanicola onchidii TaxID=2562685 RepID=UPI003B8362EC
MSRSRHSRNEETNGRMMAEETQGAEPVLLKTVVLVGMMGAGKTAVGRTLAAQLGVPFKDSDHEIEAAANMTIAEIFERDGEPFFRRKETQIIDRLLDGDPCVLSTGGGAFMSAENREMISAKGVSVWLNADLEVLWERVRHKDTRPLLRSPDPKGTLTALYENRVPTYALADVTVLSEGGRTLDAQAGVVRQALLDSRPDVLEKKT